MGKEWIKENFGVKLVSETYNIYCDESCHLENDKMPVMVLGGVWCPKKRVREISRKIRDIKLEHGLSKTFEIKWTKVSPGKIDFYLELVDYFFSEIDIHFRGVVIPDKSQLNHNLYNQSHDDWYYKMFFVLLKEIIDPLCGYHIYIDINDTRSEIKRAKLEEVLRNCHYDANGNIVKSIQQIRSHESQIMQLADLLIGALRYSYERLESSGAKRKMIERIQQRSRKSLLQTTWPKEAKFNILIWRPGGGEL